MKKLILIFIFLLSCSSTSVEQIQKAELAEKKFAEGNLEESFKLYQELEKSGIYNSLIYERLAESSRDNALAVFYLRKALLIDPNCNSCSEKLEHSRANIKFNPMLRTVPLIKPNLRSILLISISSFLSIWLLCFQFLPRRIFLIGLIPLSSAAFWIFSGTYCGSDFPFEIESCLIRGKRDNERQAVVIKDDSFSFSSKDQNSQGVLSLPKGSEIIISKIQDEWALVSLPKNRIGWIQSENIKLID